MDHIFAQYVGFLSTYCAKRFKDPLTESVNQADVNQARKEVERFVKSPENLSIWSHEFFLDVATRIKFAEIERGMITLTSQ
jgi:hypothetical protein